MRRQDPGHNDPESGEQRSVIELVRSPLGRITGSGPTHWSLESQASQVPACFARCADILRPLRTRQLEMLPQHRSGFASTEMILIKNQVVSAMVILCRLLPLQLRPR